jgi:hypothetical protein
MLVFGRLDVLFAALRWIGWGDLATEKGDSQGFLLSVGKCVVGTPGGALIGVELLCCAFMGMVLHRNH